MKKKYNVWLHLEEVHTEGEQDIESIQGADMGYLPQKAAVFTELKHALKFMDYFANQIDVYENLTQTA